MLLLVWHVLCVVCYFPRDVYPRVKQEQINTISREVAKSVIENVLKKEKGLQLSQKPEKWRKIF